MKSTIGETIRQLRREKELSAETLGAFAGVSSGAIYSYEKGVAIPPLNVIEKIAKKFEMTPEELLGYSKTKSQNTTNYKDELVEHLKRENQRLLWMLDKYIPGIATVGSNFSEVTIHAGGAYEYEPRVVALAA